MYEFFDDVDGREKLLNNSHQLQCFNDTRFLEITTQTRFTTIEDT